MTLLDYYANHNYYLPNQININPFEQHKQESFYDTNNEFPSEVADLLCFDPLPPSLFDFEVPHFSPPPLPDATPLNIDYLNYTTDFHVDDFIIPENNIHCYYPCNIPSFSHGFDSFVPENCGIVSHNGLTFGQDDYSYSINSNVGAVAGGRGGKIKEVTAQSKAAREWRMKITKKTQELGKLVPGGNKMNTAQMFQAAANYVKFLQAQVGIIKTIETLNEGGNNKRSNSSNLRILKSHLVQGKLYAKEKCLVPVDFLPVLKKHMDYCETDDNPSISEQIDELLMN